MFEVYFGVIVCLTNVNQKCPTKEIVGTKAYYSKRSCEEDEKLIAQAMFVKTGIKYGYRCDKVEFEPPLMEK